MDTEKKEYSIVGTVTIGTDEYRDLIESVKDNEQKAAEAERYRWDYYHRATKAEQERDELKKKLEQYKKFIDENKDRYELWIVKNVEL